MLDIERLCTLLDERGVEYKYLDYEVIWESEFGCRCMAFRRYLNNNVDLSIAAVTPNEAVNLTLGREGCIMYACDGGFANTNLPVWQCSCGAFTTQYTDMTTFHKPRYCPNCGRAVVDD